MIARGSSSSVLDVVVALSAALALALSGCSDFGSSPARGSAQQGDDDFAGDGDPSGDDDDLAVDWAVGAAEPLDSSSVSIPSGEITIEPPPGVSALERTAVTDFAESVEFLYSGVTPVQVGVEPVDIEPHRVAVLRGRVLHGDGRGVPGIEITVLHHGEYGHTLSRSDGGFDLAVNGGGDLTVRYRADGWIPVQRLVHAPWRDYVWLPDVVMTPFDVEVTTVDLDGSSGAQVHRASPVSDADGFRQASLLIASDTRASLVFADGTTELADTLDVRATEFTVGDVGPDAMPGDLPPTSAYTYAVELSADEIESSGAVSVEFSEPVVLHVDNFLGFPAGIPVPSGYYDREAGVWVPSESGRVVGVLDNDGATVSLDVDGSGVAADEEALDGLGIGDDELAEIAASFGTGDSLWRVPIRHFTPYDLNWGWEPPYDAMYPDGGPWWDDPLDDGMCEAGSILECHNQVLGETIGVTGTPFALSYRSHRMPGYLDGMRMDVQTAVGELPESLLRIEARVQVAGRTFYPEVSLDEDSFLFTGWSAELGYDGFGAREDAYGRLVQGQTPVTVDIGYVYLAEYTQADTFGYSGSGFETWEPARQEVTLWRSWTTTLGILDAGAAGLGGWTFGPHHAHDPVGRTVYFGNGAVQRGDASSLASVVTTVAGSGGMGDGGYVPAGRQATTVDLRCPTEVAIDDGGSPHFAQGRYLRHVDGDVLVTVSGDVETSCAEGDRVEDCSLGEIAGLTRGSHGWAWYGAQASPPVVWGIDDSGRFHVIADGTSELLDDGHPHDPFGAGEVIQDVAADTSGNVYFTLNQYIYRVAADGVVSRYAGNGELGVGDDGVAATESGGFFRHLTVADDGTLFTAVLHQWSQFGSMDPMVATVDAQGVLGHVTDRGEACHGELGPEGAFASQWIPCNLDSLAAAPDGALVVADDFNGVLHRISAGGVVMPFAGGGDMPGDGGVVDGTAAADAWFDGLQDVAVGPDGTAYATVCHQHRVLSFAPPLPPEYGDDLAVPVGDAMLLFDSEGRHLRTIHALTGAALVEFGYDGEGLLTEIVDADGNVTSIERDGHGEPLAIVAPGGQRTSLTVDADGFLVRVENPAAEAFDVDYWSGRAGLIESFTPPKGSAHASRYLYDSEYARLSHADDPAGGSKDLTRTESLSGREIALVTGLSRTRLYTTHRDDADAVEKTFTSSSGAQTTTTTHADGLVVTTRADGVRIESQQRADPRWGMAAPLTEQVIVTTPIDELTAMITRGREIELDDPLDLLSLVAQTDSVTLNGRTYTRAYDASDLSVTYTSPEVRAIVVYLDDLGRGVEIDIDPSIEPLYIEYDALGRLERLSQGDLSTDLEYDALNRLETVEDGLQRRVRYTYDDADRVRTVTLPSGREYGIDHDDHGNLTDLQMPTQVVHQLAQDALDRADTYTPPGGADPYDLDHDVDRLPDLLTLPSGRTVDYAFESPEEGSRLLTVTYDEATVSHDYDDATARLGTLSRTPTVGDSSQDLLFEHDGFLVTRVTARGAADGHYSYTYDDQFALESLSLTSGSETEDVVIHRDDDGLVERVGTFDVDRLGPLGMVSDIHDDSLAITYQYDPLGRPWITTHAVDGVEILRTELHYDAANRIDHRYENHDGDLLVYEYTYDLDGQLIQVRRDDALVEEYTYDLNGNRSTTLFGTAQHDDLDRITQRDGLDYHFDDDGYLVQRDADTFVYSTRGELIEATISGDTITYEYDGFARRTARTDDSGTSAYLYGNLSAPFQLTASRDPAGILTTYHYDAAGHLMAFKRGDPWDQAVWYYVATDPVGTPRIVSDADGNVVKVLEHDSHGVLLYDSDSSFELEVGFAGGIADSVTSLVRFGYRDYEPAAGRWTARDPILFAGGQANLYVYVGGDPVNHVDPLGLWTFGVGLGFTAGGVVGVSGSVIVVGDGHNNAGIVLSFGIGGYFGLGGSLGAVVQYTSADTIFELEGACAQIGGSIGEGGTIGAEILIGDGYLGVNVNPAVGGSPWIPFEVHGLVERAWVVEL